MIINSWSFFRMLPTSCEDANLSDCKIISSKGFGEILESESDPSETEYELRRAINIVAYLAMSVGKSFYSTRTQTINIFEHLITGHNDYFLSLFFYKLISNFAQYPSLLLITFLSIEKVFDRALQSKYVSYPIFSNSERVITPSFTLAAHSKRMTK